jgi:hypothetical protein
LIEALGSAVDCDRFRVGLGRDRLGAAAQWFLADEQGDDDAEGGYDRAPGEQCGDTVRRLVEYLLTDRLASCGGE